MSHAEDWPVCAECTLMHQGRGGEGTIPVEEYGCEVDESNRVLYSGNYSVRVRVVASCSHGRGFRRDAVQTQQAEPIDCPHWWNVDRDNPLASQYLRAAVRSIRFFEPGGARPSHRMVVRVT